VLPSISYDFNNAFGKLAYTREREAERDIYEETRKRAD
jgi:hypothetical protein